MPSMPKIRGILLLLFLPPVLGELLSGNAPPLRFFSPGWLVVFVLLYGCGTLLIREAVARWRLQWSVLFLAVAYGIVEEGLTTKAIFNPQWQGTGTLSGYGMFWGVQWVWAIGVTFFHATVSTLIPITIVERLWPSARHSPLLGKVGLGLALGGFAAITLLGMLSIGTAEGERTIPFHPKGLLLAVASGTVVLLCWLAYHFRGRKLRSGAVPLMSPVCFAVAGFFVQAFFLVVPNEMVKQGASGTAAVAVELTVVCLALAFVFLQLCHRRVTMRHITALIIGSLMPYILLTPVHEFLWKWSPANPKTGMLAVGLLATVLLFAWRSAVLAKDRQDRPEHC
jgi:hypothetical protein